MKYFKWEANGICSEMLGRVPRSGWNEGHLHLAFTAFFLHELDLVGSLEGASTGVPAAQCPSAPILCLLPSLLGNCSQVGRV